jgi:hypothetical protein
MGYYLLTEEMLEESKDSHCRICNEQLKPGRRVFFEKDTIVHASCLEKKIKEKKRGEVK